MVKMVRFNIRDHCNIGMVFFKAPVRLISLSYKRLARTGMPAVNASPGCADRTSHSKTGVFQIPLALRRQYLRKHCAGCCFPMRARNSNGILVFLHKEGKDIAPMQKQRPAFPGSNDFRVIRLYCA